VTHTVPTVGNHLSEGIRETMESLTPVVLVHGFWHGGWCWSLLSQELAHRGVASVAVDLDGHGLKSRAPRSRWSRPFDAAGFAVEPSPVAGIKATSAASTLVEQIRRIGAGRPCVVVVHSMGGTVATAAAEQAPELFSRLVYLSAFAPVGGGAAVDYIGSPENAGEMVSGHLAADPAVTGALRIDTGAENHEALRRTLYQDVDTDTADAAIALLTADGPAGIVMEPFTVTAERFGSVAHSYIVCRYDNAIPAALQHRFIREIDALAARPTTVIEIDSGHSPFLSQPEALAEAVQRACR
jgi:pimeloyl-ACP methyl ester carboxylesterase